MIVLRYTRLGTRRFLSHIDVLRDFGRIVRRADIPVGYSGGFNPHALLFFSPPMPVGVGSVAEYAAIDTPLTADETAERFNAASGEDMRAEEAFEVPRNPNLAGRIVAASYLFPFAADAYDFSRGLTVEYVKKGETVREDVSERIFAAGEKDGRMLLTLASGNVTLRADRVFAALKGLTGCDGDVSDVVKTEQFFREDGVLVPVREALVRKE